MMAVSKKLQEECNAISSITKVIDFWKEKSFLFWGSRDLFNSKETRHKIAL